jgi:hypothetical protein
MPIIKNKQKDKFAHIPNATLRDKRLGLDTRGFLAELLTHREDLDVSVEWLMEHFRVGRDKLLRMTNELKAGGYIEITTVHADKGLLLGKEWFIYNEPTVGSTVIRETRTTAKADDSLKREDQEEEKKEEKEDMPSSRKSANVGLSVTKVFDYWKEALSHPRSILDQKRKRLIEARLKEGYSEEDLRQAIRGIKNSPHNMGRNDTGTVYDDITLICRDAAHVERFMGMDGHVNEAAIQTALKESRAHHDQKHAGLEFTPAYDPAMYVGKWPALQKYVDDIASGVRSLSAEDNAVAEKERLFNESVLEQHRFYSQFGRAKA